MSLTFEAANVSKMNPRCSDGVCLSSGEQGDRLGSEVRAADVQERSEE